jgi:hypothetical protein
MQRFFLSLCELARFSHSDAHLSSLEACDCCHQHQYWVPHGFVYKKLSSTKQKIIGRRLFCSYRHGRHGCGRTRQLYLDQVIPRRHYPLSTITQFILLLFNQLSITQAYQLALGKHVEARQAYRWLTALYQNMGRWRLRLDKNHRDQDDIPDFSSHRLRVLIPTLRDFLQPDPLAVQYRLQRPLV